MLINPLKSIGLKDFETLNNELYIPFFLEASPFQRHAIHHALKLHL